MSTNESIRNDDTRSMPVWIMPLLLLLLAAMGVWYFLKGSGEAPKVAVQQPAPVEVKEPESPARISTKVVLIDGTELDAYKGGIEDKLVACLSDSACKPGKELWFDFDNLNFDMGSAKITAESEVQVKNIAAILKAYPNLKIKIGGYTDKTGNPDANKKLSQDRAQATNDAIVAAGANPAQLEKPEGYGSDFATVPAEASEDDRRIDRRISVSVRAK